MAFMHFSTIADRVAPHSSAGTLELGAEYVAIQIRWFGLAVGAALANFGTNIDNAWQLNGILALGLGFTALNTVCFVRGRVFLRDDPLLIAAMEALFIGLLCYFEAGLDSSYRFYYFLSLICAAVRYSPRITIMTFGFDGLSYAMLFLFVPMDQRPMLAYLTTMVALGWVTWGASAMARLLKRTGGELQELNQKLQENQSQLELRINERTQELEESQAQVLHQEKMAAFGLLAAGIAHEVGNPLSGISQVVQMLEKRNPDEYTRTKLGHVTAQLSRIQTILRELIVFSRPANAVRGRVHIRDVIDDALSIAKYYKGGQNRKIEVVIDEAMPSFTGVRDQLVQLVFNLILNAIDATGQGGEIRVMARHDESQRIITVTVADNGCGIDSAIQQRLFRPYFTTKKHGTGLGLFVIRRIVESHGGTVNVHSHLGQGATFLVNLPV